MSEQYRHPMEARAADGRPYDVRHVQHGMPQTSREIHASQDDMALLKQLMSDKGFSVPLPLNAFYQFLTMNGLSDATRQRELARAAFLSGLVKD